MKVTVVGCFCTIRRHSEKQTHSLQNKAVKRNNQK
jgi:hypothetical protein